MLILLYILLALLAVFLLLMAIPLRLRMHLTNEQSQTIVGIGRVTVFDSAKPRKRYARARVDQKSPKEPEQKSKEPEAVVARPKSHFERILDGLRIFGLAIQISPQILMSMARYTVRLLKPVRFEGFNVSFAGGLDDPALTGSLMGYFHAVNGAAPGFGRRVAIYPDYLAETVRYDINADFSYRPISAIWPTVQFFWELPKRGMYRLVKEIKLAKSGDRVGPDFTQSRESR